ncbi:MAG: pre-peptidase C-terminal domain-containing protein [Gimesia sp.]|nr:pre-peptidase C-terminal domain-containing protein [Gimesia sp.]
MNTAKPMNYFTAVFLMLSAVLSFQQSVSAQLPTADLRRISPFSAIAGKTVDMTIVGTNLDQTTELRFTHPGIIAKPVLLPTDDLFPQARIQNTRFKVTVSPEVPPGIYEARAVSYFGLSTARPFVVAASDSREVQETGTHATRETAMSADVNSVITGDVPSRGIDWYKFKAKAGQRVLVEIHAERLDSRMDGQIVVYDSNGREVDRNRDWYGRDPFIEVQPKQDGEFYLAISDILYRGGTEHFYRLSISDKPHIDYIFPPAGEPGSRKTYTIYGRNLPGGSFGKSVLRNGQKLESLEVEITLPDVPMLPARFQPEFPRQGLLYGSDYRLKNSNTVSVGFATAPVVIESAQSNQQKVSVPVEIAGRFDEPNDEDVFQFRAEKGKTYCIDVISDRMQSQVDAALEVQQVIRSKSGEVTLKKVAENDDLPSFFSVHNKDAINLNTNDAALSFIAPETGDYNVTVLNQFGGGGTADIYRLAIREPKPDFQLIATTERTLPSGRTGYSVTPLLRQGAKWGIRIVAPRQDGFEGDIVITADNLPPGVSAQPLTLSGKTDHGMLVISASPSAKSWAGEIKINGTALVNRKPMVREAKFASLIWGHVFSDAIRVRSRLTTHIPLSVNGQEKASVILSPVENKEWTVEINQKLEIPIQVVDNGTRKGNLTVEPHGLFGMLRSPPTVNIAEKETEGKLVIDFRSNGNFKVEPGRYQFTLLGVGVTQYRYNVPASIKAAAEVKRIDHLITQIKADVERTKAAVEKTKLALTQAKQNVAQAGSNPSSDANMKKAQLDYDSAVKSAKAATDKFTRAEKAKTQVDATAKTTESIAKPKDNKFAVWSDLITVIVKPAAKKK